MYFVLSDSGGPMLPHYRVLAGGFSTEKDARVWMGRHIGARAGVFVVRRCRDHHVGIERMK